LSDEVIGKLYVVRLYDGFDNEWMDVTVPLPYDEALAEWNLRTDDGQKMTKFEDIDYYRIFPSDTRMLFSAD
jgi:hypothetical protein